MGTIADKLSRLLDTKHQIRAAIGGKGVTVPETTAFREYPQLIGQIETGAGVPLQIRACYNKHNSFTSFTVPVRIIGIHAAVE